MVSEVRGKARVLYSKSQVKNTYRKWENDQLYQILMINQYRTRDSSLDLSTWISLDILLTRAVGVKAQTLGGSELRENKKM